MKMKEHVHSMRLKNLEEQLVKMDTTFDKVDLEGVVFNMGKLLLELLENQGSISKVKQEVSA